MLSRFCRRRVVASQDSNQSPMQADLIELSCCIAADAGEHIKVIRKGFGCAVRIVDGDGYAA